MRYCIKSCNSEDVNTLLAIIKDYTKHCEKFPGTLLPRFLGLYSISHKKELIYLVVQSNVFAGHRAIEERYDLKGSMFGRKASSKELSNGPKAVLKDLDFLRRGRALPFQCEEQREHFLRKLEVDVAWLRSQGLMDYSLLVGFSNFGDDRPTSKYIVDVLRLRQQSDHQPYDMAYVGIVDILTRFSWFKKCEASLLGVVLGDISCMPPNTYAERLLEFAKHVTVLEVEDSWKQIQIRKAHRKMVPFEEEFGKKDAKTALARVAPIFMCVGLKFIFTRLRQQRSSAFRVRAHDNATNQVGSRPVPAAKTL
ncbi:hypothetical protein CYMTET_13413 [Cymbomonas tetramitiformis]|uniref:1-phosphatidylinositol-4-phosphate 5-kinase n=1 Tax=Cymbomonas tetramitiformis TaxID=36881 RepID=A0AAE0GIG6_9CHLO|nr:hypothetical protein CYMTET_13413 [Cymbomonas tetramitiformis]